VLLNLAGGDCVEDIKKLEADDGFCEVLKKAEIHGLRRKVRRALLRRWRKEKTRTVPSPSSIFRYLAKFHNKEQEGLRQPGKAFIPAPNEHLQGLVKINKDLAAFSGFQNSESTATLDMDATLVATNKVDYIATGKGEKKDQRFLDECNRKVKKPDFVYDADKDCFICPAGHMLELRNRTGDDKKIYQARSEDCDQCSYRSRCCKSKKGNPRTVSTDSKEPLRQEMVEKMKKESSREIYKKRKTIVEPVFGQIKKNMGFRGFSVRGFIKAGGEFSLVCAAHNIKKVVKSIGYKLKHLEENKLVPMAA